MHPKPKYHKYHLVPDHCKEIYNQNSGNFNEFRNSINGYFFDIFLEIEEDMVGRFQPSHLKNRKIKVFFLVGRRVAFFIIIYQSILLCYLSIEYMSS